MIDAERGVTILDLGEGEGKELSLWFPLGAIKHLTMQLKIEDLHPRSAGLVLEHMRNSNMGVFIWAGRLWEDRGKSDRKDEDIIAEYQGRVEWTERSHVYIYDTITEAINQSIVGKERWDEIKAEQKRKEEEAEDSGKAST